jgi:hypothetical protein
MITVWERKCLKTKHFRSQTTIMTGRPAQPVAGRNPSRLYHRPDPF